MEFKVKVINNDEHGFDIGEIVTCTDIENDNKWYHCKNERGMYQVLLRNEFEIISNVILDKIKY